MRWRTAQLAALQTIYHLRAHHELLRKKKSVKYKALAWTQVLMLLHWGLRWCFVLCETKKTFTTCPRRCCCCLNPPGWLAARDLASEHLAAVRIYTQNYVAWTRSKKAAPDTHILHNIHKHTHKITLRLHALYTVFMLCLFMCVGLT